MHQIYTFGYTDQLPHQLQALAEHLDAVLVWTSVSALAAAYWTGPPAD
jgi:hypothetical protein